MKILSIVIFALLHACSVGMPAGQVDPISYTIDIPGYILHYSLPPDIARSSKQKSWSQLTPEALSASLQKDGFRVISSLLHDYKIPLRFGAAGSFKMSVMVQKCAEGYTGNVSTTRGLEDYLHWWASSRGANDFTLEPAMLHGISAIKRWRSSLTTKSVTSATHRDETEIFSIPLSDKTFLDIGFIFIEWYPNSANQWAKHARTSSEAIKGTLQLKSKVEPNQTPQPITHGVTPPAAQEPRHRG